MVLRNRPILSIDTERLGLFEQPPWRAAGDPRLARGRSWVRAPAPVGALHMLFFSTLPSFLLREIVFFSHLPHQPRKSVRVDFVHCCCCLLMLLPAVVVCCENRLTFGSNFHIMLWWISTKVGSYMQHGNPHLLMRSEVIWGQVVRCESGLIWKVEVRLEPNLVYWYNMGTFIRSWGQRSYTKVKGHLRSSCMIGWKCENGLIWKVEVWFEQNLVYWYNRNLHMFMWSKGHKSRSKVIWGQLVR